MLEPFATYFILETNDPDTYDLEFVDSDTAYANENNDPAIIKPDTVQFIDVNYTNVEKRQNHNGYIASLKTSSVTDGGSLTMKRMTDYSGTYLDTTVNVTLPVLKSNVQCLLDTYTRNDQSFFEKMNSVQMALDNISVYPRAVLNTSKPTGRYLSLACSPYKELSLNKHYENIYYLYSQSNIYLLSQDLYPFVLDSLEFPGMLKAVAKKT